jgi:hypothetical protein
MLLRWTSWVKEIIISGFCYGCLVWTARNITPAFQTVASYFIWINGNPTGQIRSLLMMMMMMMMLVCNGDHTKHSFSLVSPQGSCYFAIWRYWALELTEIIWTKMVLKNLINGTKLKFCTKSSRECLLYLSCLSNLRTWFQWSVEREDLQGGGEGLGECVIK